MSITIRKAQEKDIDTIAHNVLEMAFEGSQTTLSHETVSNGVKSLFKKPELGFYIVAEIEGKVVGSLVVVNEWSDWENGIRWWIHSVYVTPEYRRQGIYTDMYGYVKKEAELSNEIIGLSLFVSKDNEKAQNAYKHAGMREIDKIVYTDDDVK